MNEMVTVIIPNHNGLSHLKGCLHSLLALPEQDFSVILVDNGSTDESVPFVTQQYPTIQIISLPSNKGFAYAVNRGIEAAHTPYVILLNNDTIVCNGFVKYLLNAIRKDPHCFSVGAKMRRFDHPELTDNAGDLFCILGYAFARGKDLPQAHYTKSTKIFSTCAGAAIYNRSLLLQLGMFDETFFAYLEDVDIGYRARIHGYVNKIEPRANVLHIGSAHSGSRYNTFKTPLVAANNVRLIAHNMPFVQLLFNLPFLLIGFTVKILFYKKKKMGRLYIKGLAKGLAACITPADRARKVQFQRKNLRNYLRIQWELYTNLIQLIFPRKSKEH
ncbi:MAG: glycosyltransferase family 2 protein [Lachnospiraceae bacterium]|nr:glycosyltransferase family 2 protein [Lachnospiraceae bacterium]